MAEKDYTAKRDDYKTPPWIYETILNIIDRPNFDLDVCCSEPNIPALSRCFSFMDDGLKAKWRGKVFFNPPFPKTRYFVRKAVESVREDKNTEVWAVLPADRLETGFYQECIIKNPDCLFAFIPQKVGFIIPGEEDKEPVPSQKIMIAAFIKRALDLQYSWNYYDWFNTKAFVGYKEYKK